MWNLGFLFGIQFNSFIFAYFGQLATQVVLLVEKFFFPFKKKIFSSKILDFFVYSLLGLLRFCTNQHKIALANFVIETVTESPIIYTHGTKFVTELKVIANILQNYLNY